MAKLEILGFVVIIGVFIWAFMGWQRESKAKRLANRIPTDEEISLDNYIQQVKVKISAAETQAMTGIADAESRLVRYKAQLEKAVERKKQLENI